MKVLHISAASETTGAGKAALITHKALLSQGVESSLLFLKSQCREAGVCSFHRESPLNRIVRFLSTKLDYLPVLLSRRKSYELFSPGWVGVPLKSHQKVVDSDLVHIHWSCQGFINIKEIGSWNKPVVWTLRDMWPFTGGCHQSFDCEGFIHDCRTCPVLGNGLIPLNVALRSQDSKRITFENLPVTWIAISNWLKKKAQESRVLRHCSISVIPSGVDSSRFGILAKSEARNTLGIDSQAQIILVGANDIRERYKGFSLACDALRRVSPHFVVHTFGRTTFQGEIPQKVRHFGLVSEETAAQIYSSSDLFLGPSVAEAMGKTFLEAQLCGLPVVCFKETGPEDIVRHKITGYASEFGSVDDLVAGICFCLTNSFDRETIRNYVKGTFDIEHVARMYCRIYDKSILGWSARKSV